MAPRPSVPPTWRLWDSAPFWKRTLLPAPDRAFWERASVYMHCTHVIFLSPVPKTRILLFSRFLFFAFRTRISSVLYVGRKRWSAPLSLSSRSLRRNQTGTPDCHPPSQRSLPPTALCASGTTCGRAPSWRCRTVRTHRPRPARDDSTSHCNCPHLLRIAHAPLAVVPPAPPPITAHQRADEGCNFRTPEPRFLLNPIVGCGSSQPCVGSSIPSTSRTPLICFCG